MSDIPLQPPAEILVEGGAAGENDILVEASANVDGRLLDDAIDDGGERGQEVGGVDFGVEEDFRGEESFVANIHGHAPSVRGRDGVFQESIGLAVEAGELFDHVRADVAVFLLDLFCGLETAVGLASISKKGLDEVCDISAGDRDAFDRAANHVALCNWYDVGHAVAGVNYDSGKGAVGDFGGCPRRGEGEDGLDGNIEAGAIEGFEHDFRRVFSVLGGI